MFKNINLPNKITILRILLTPILIFFMTIKYGGYSFYSFFDSMIYIIVVSLFIFIALTDFIDGYIARKNNLVTNLGKLLDPIADKIFVFSILIVFVKYDILSLWIVLILLSREFIVVAIRTMMVENNAGVVAASNLGKLKTVCQMIAMLIIIITPLGKLLNSVIMTPALIFSILSMIEYLKISKEYIWKEI